VTAGSPAAPGRLLFVNARQVVTCAGPARARRGRDMSDAGVREHTAVLVGGGEIVALGDERELIAGHRDATIVDCRGGVLTPGFVDSHTHAIFGSPRYDEQELRAAGVG